MKFTTYNILFSMNLILKFFTIQLVKLFTKLYKRYSLLYLQQPSSALFDKLVIIQSLLYFLKQQFKPFRYFNDSRLLEQLFSGPHHLEVPQVIQHHPEAVRYYKAKIHEYSHHDLPVFHKEIKAYLQATYNTTHFYSKR